MVINGDVDEEVIDVVVKSVEEVVNEDDEFCKMIGDVVWRIVGLGRFNMYGNEFG